MRALDQHQLVEHREEDDDASSDSVLRSVLRMQIVPGGLTENASR